MSNNKTDSVKNVFIFLLFILMLFFISNDKKFNKLFQKNIMKILFLISLIYMAYLKINIGIIISIFFIYLLFNTDVGKKLQKNKYIKKILKIINPYTKPIIETVEDFISSFTNIPDDDSSVASSVIMSNKKKVHFEDEEEDDFDEDSIFDKIESDVPNEGNVDFDVLDEIRSSMKLDMDDSNNDSINNDSQETSIENLMNQEDEESVTLDQNDIQEIRELYKQYSSTKQELQNIDE